MAYFKVLSLPKSATEVILDHLKKAFAGPDPLCLAYSFLFVTGGLSHIEHARCIKTIQKAHEAELGTSSTRIPQRFLTQLGVCEIEVSSFESAITTYGHAVIVYSPPGKDEDHAIAISKVDGFDGCIATITNTLDTQGLPMTYTIPDIPLFQQKLPHQFPSGFTVVCYPPESAMLDPLL